MESTDRELILKFMSQDPMLRKLYIEHKDLEDRLGEFNTKSWLTADEQMERNRLKKQKLFGVDKMMMILDRHRESPAVMI